MTHATLNESWRRIPYKAERPNIHDKTPITDLQKDIDQDKTDEQNNLSDEESQDEDDGIFKKNYQ